MSILHALLQILITAPVEALAYALSEDRRDSRDTRDDPVYKQKLQELIERNRKFEEERAG